MNIITNIIKSVIKGFGTMFNYPLVRHMIAAIGIIFALWFLTISPLQRQNTLLLENYEKMNFRQYQLIKVMSEIPKVQIQNQVDIKKQKDGSTVTLIPDNLVEANETLSHMEKEVIDDGVEIEKAKKKEKIGFRFWKKEFWQ